MTSTADTVREYYKGPISWVPERTVFLTKHGSHAYGLATPESDLDVKGIVVAPEDVYLGLLPKRGKARFEQAIQGVKGAGDEERADLVIFEIRKFIMLATECNPNIIEVLFTHTDDHLVVTPFGERLIAERRLFLSRHAYHRFASYATSQMRRMVNHHAWLRNPPKAPPTRAELGLPERTVIPKDQLAAAKSAVEKKLARWNLTDMDGIEPAVRITLQETMAEMIAEIGVTADETWNAAARSVGYSENFIRLLDLERQYHSKQQHWREYQDWIKNRNQARAELEAKYGFDTKHGSTLMRLLLMCREILTDGSVIVRRPDRERILGVRRGDMTCEELVEWAKAMNSELEALYHVSPLPLEPARDAINDLCADLVRAALATLPSVRLS